MIIYRNRVPGTTVEQRQFNYVNKNGTPITDLDTLNYIKKMAIPPAYEKVKIDLSSTAKIIFEGTDAMGRLQQRYSTLHNTKAKKAKFCRLMEFGKAYPKIQADIKHHLEADRMTHNKIIAIILQIIWQCGFRIGNAKYLHLYESHGISNIYKKHITFQPNSAKIEFKGKKGVINTCCITNKILLKELLTLTKDIGDTDHVFTFKGELVKSSEINKWLGKYGDISSKDLRTFDVNVMFIDYMRSVTDDIQLATTPAKRKKVAKRALEVTSTHINNTVGICKSSYLMVEIYNMFVEQPRRFKKYFLGGVASRIAFVNYLKDYCL